MPKSVTPKKASKLASKKASIVVKPIRQAQGKKLAKKPSVKTIKPSKVIAKAKETVEKVTAQKSARSTSSGPTDYSAAQIQVLEGLEPVRKRPGMYIGSTDIIGLHETLREIIDNGVDEALAGFAKNVWIVLNNDGSATVVDDGRGIPIDIMPHYKKSALEIVMTKLHAGGKFGGSAYKISGGLHGVGSSVVNALSEWMWVEVRRGGKIYKQEYKRGKPTTGLEILKDTKLDIENFNLKQNSGTTVTFLPDSQVFSTTEFDFETIKKAIRERAYLVPSLYFHLY